MQSTNLSVERDPGIAVDDLGQGLAEVLGVHLHRRPLNFLLLWLVLVEVADDHQDVLLPPITSRRPRRSLLLPNVVLVPVLVPSLP